MWAGYNCTCRFTMKQHVLKKHVEAAGRRFLLTSNNVMCNIHKHNHRQGKPFFLCHGNMKYEGHTVKYRSAAAVFAHCTCVQ